MGLGMIPMNSNMLPYVESQVVYTFKEENKAVFSSCIVPYIQVISWDIHAELQMSWPGVFKSTLKDSRRDPLHMGRLPCSAWESGNVFPVL